MVAKLCFPYVSADRLTDVISTQRNLHASYFYAFWSSPSINSVPDIGKEYIKEKLISGAIIYVPFEC